MQKHGHGHTMLASDVDATCETVVRPQTCLHYLLIVYMNACFFTPSITHCFRCSNNFCRREHRKRRREWRTAVAFSRCSSKTLAFWQGTALLEHRTYEKTEKRWGRSKWQNDSAICAAFPKTKLVKSEKQWSTAHYLSWLVVWNEPSEGMEFARMKYGNCAWKSHSIDDMKLISI